MQISSRPVQATKTKTKPNNRTTTKQQKQQKHNNSNRKNALNDLRGNFHKQQQNRWGRREQWGEGSEERGDKQREYPENRMLIKNQTNFLIAKRSNH